METGFVFCEVRPEGLYVIWMRVVVKLFVRCKATGHDRGMSGDLHTVIAGLQARSQHASGRSCDRPSQHRFSSFSSDFEAHPEIVPKFQVVTTCF
jgi:hypothetical protein